MPATLTPVPDGPTTASEIERWWEQLSTTPYLPLRTTDQDPTDGGSDRDAGTAARRREREARWACEWWPPE